MNILVVDDEKEIADVIALYLQNDEYQVHKFYTGEEALNCIETTKIDLALLDVMLPDIDGFEILKRIREKYTFPVIMLTAKVDYMDKITGLTLGADDYIPKTIQPAGTCCQSESAASALYTVQRWRKDRRRCN